MAYLVASGVDGLDPNDVSVIDGEGRLLSSPQDQENMASSSLYEAKQDMEGNIERTLLGLLEPIVGRGRVRARATVELNLVRQERTQEMFDPNVSMIRSEEKRKTKNRGAGAGGGGVPGAAANLPGATGAASAAGGSEDTQESVTNFELNRTVSTTSEGAGKLLRQSVAVVIDHARPVADAAADSAADGTAPTPTPRTPQEMQQITELVRAAIGYDQGRGDVLTVENIPFDPVPADDVAGGLDIVSLVLKISRFASLPLAVLLLALFVIRPAFATLRSVAQPPESEEGVPPTVAQLQAQVQAQLGAGETRMLPGANLRQKLMEGIVEDPHTAALVVRGWLSQRQPSPKKS